MAHLCRMVLLGICRRWFGVMGCATALFEPVQQGRDRRKPPASRSDPPLPPGLDAHVHIVRKALERIQIRGDRAHLGEGRNGAGPGIDDGDAVEGVVVDEVAGLDIGVERAGLGQRGCRAR